MNNLSKDVEDIIIDYQTQLHKHDHQQKFIVVLDELCKNSIYNQFDPSSIDEKIASIRDRFRQINGIVNQNQRNMELLTRMNRLREEVERDFQRLIYPFANLYAPKGQTLEKNKELWNNALIRHYEYYNNIKRQEMFRRTFLSYPISSLDMYYWSQMLVYKYAHQDLTKSEYECREEEAFGC